MTLAQLSRLRRIRQWRTPNATSTGSRTHLSRDGCCRSPVSGSQNDSRSPGAIRSSRSGCPSAAPSARQAARMRGWSASSSPPTVGERGDASANSPSAPCTGPRYGPPRDAGTSAYAGSDGKAPSALPAQSAGHTPATRLIRMR